MTNAEFLDLLFANRASNAVPWVTAFESPPGDASRGEWAGWPALPGRFRSVPRRGNTYVVVSSFVPDENNRYPRRKAQFSAMHAVMVDDIGAKIAESAIALPFTVLIETSPGNCQGWMRLDPPITDRALGERLVDAMIEAGLTCDGRDSGMKGVTRYGRLPEGTNTKPRPTGPWLHRVLEVRAGLSYSVDEIAEAYELDLTPPPARAPRTEPVGPLPDVLGKLHALGLYQAPLGDGWHAITCPWSHEHTGGVTTGTAYREPAPENDMVGGFRCHHGHCEGRGIGLLFRFLERVAALQVQA